MKKSELEREFETLWIQIDGPPLQPEYRFHPTRKWRFDFAHVETMICIELEGGVWSGGRHVRGQGFISDCEKYNAAQLLGWRVFRFTTDMLKDPYRHLVPVRDLIRVMLSYDKNTNQKSPS